MGRWKVVDNSFDLHIEDTYATEDKHETNIYDIYALCKRLNDLEAICSHQKEVIQPWKDECKQLEDKCAHLENSVKRQQGSAEEGAKQIEELVAEIKDLKQRINKQTKLLTKCYRNCKI